MDNIKVKPKKDELLLKTIQNVINDPINYETLDDTEIYYWLSYLPEATKFLSKKMNIVNKKLADLELEIEIIESNIKLEIYAGEGAINLKKELSNLKLYQDQKYVEYRKQINELNQLAAEYKTELSCVNDKFLSVRKAANLQNNEVKQYDNRS